MTRTDRPLLFDLLPIRFLWLDVDGVLSSGQLSYIELPDGVSRTPGPSVARMVSFDSHDGHGLAMLREAGVAFGFISGNSSEAVRARAEKLGAAECHLGVDSDDGAAAWRGETGPVGKRGKRNYLYVTATSSRLSGLRMDECAYMGDDLNDVEAMLACGLAIAPANATEGAKAAAHYVTAKRGGEGAVREAVEFILRHNAERAT